MTDSEKQAAYAAKRRERAGLHVTPQTVTRDVRHSGQPVMDTPLRITFRADKEDETREILHKAGLVFANEPDLPGAFY